MIYFEGWAFFGGQPHVKGPQLHIWQPYVAWILLGGAHMEGGPYMGPPLPSHINTWHKKRASLEKTPKRRRDHFSCIKLTFGNGWTISYMMGHLAMDGS